MPLHLMYLVVLCQSIDNANQFDVLVAALNQLAILNYNAD
jgi:hypothetical protein